MTHSVPTVINSAELLNNNNKMHSLLSINDSNVLTSPSFPHQGVTMSLQVNALKPSHPCMLHKYTHPSTHVFTKQPVQ